MNRGVVRAPDRTRRAHGRALIDRDAQALPVPLGDARPVRVVRRGGRRALRHRSEAVLTMLGCLAAIAGVVLLCTPAPVSAYLSGDRIHIGAMTLTQIAPAARAGTRLYGGDASYALSEPGDGTARAAAAWTQGGVMRTATCNLRSEPLRLIDECTFDTGSSALTSVDVLDLRGGSTWRRTYADGRQVDISVSSDGAAVPVAFPIGR